MITVTDFTTYFNQYISRLAEKSIVVSAIVFVSSEDEVPDTLKDLSGNILVVVLPSANSIGNLDSHEDINTSIIFALTKRDHADMDQQGKLSAFQLSQDVILATRGLMLEDCADYSGSCHFMHELNTEGINIDPVSYYRGWIGWGMVWEVKTL